MNEPASLREHLAAAMVRLDDSSPRMLVRINLMAALAALDRAEEVRDGVSVARLVLDPPLAKGQTFNKVSQAI